MKSSIQPVSTLQRSDHRRIADELRDQIVKQRLVGGSKLPTTRELATTWNASLGTIYNALQSLTKEGWIERVHGSGTFVTQFENRFACAGIYHDRDVFTNEDASFTRTLHTCLLKQLSALGKETLVFVDSRPENRQGRMLPALAEAIRHRRIQCLIAPTLNDIDFPALIRLNVPTAFPNNRLNFHNVGFDLEDMLRKGVRSLAKQGCRTVGLLTSMPVADPSVKVIGDNFYPCFRQAAQAEGVTIHEHWIRKPPKWIPSFDLKRYGYEEFKKLWALPKKPDGLIIYPDTVVRGAILAILKLGLQVPEQMKFVFHGNAHGRLLCPFPTTWVISDEAQMAAQLIQMIQKQFNGETVSSVSLPHSLESDEGAG